MLNNDNSVKDTAGMMASFDSIFKRMLKLCMLDYYFCLPCVVVAVNLDKQTVDIRPVLKSYSKATNTSSQRALIADVPFWMYRANDTYITLPIKPGDTGLAIFSQRDITNWKEVGGEVVLQSDRIHDYNDALYLPYFGAAATAVPNYNPENITIVKNGKPIEVKDGILDAPDYHINCKSIYASSTIDADGTITSTIDCVSGTISGATHTHGGVTSGHSNTGVPQ